MDAETVTLSFKVKKFFYFQQHSNTLKEYNFFFLQKKLNTRIKA